MASLGVEHGQPPRSFANVLQVQPAPMYRLEHLEEDGQDY